MLKAFSSEKKKHLWPSDVIISWRNMITWFLSISTLEGRRAWFVKILALVQKSRLMHLKTAIILRIYWHFALCSFAFCFIRWYYIHSFILPCQLYCWLFVRCHLSNCGFVFNENNNFDFDNYTKKRESVFRHHIDHHLWRSRVASRWNRNPKRKRNQAQRKKRRMFAQ